MLLARQLHLRAARTSALKRMTLQTLTSANASGGKKKAQSQSAQAESPSADGEEKSAHQRFEEHFKLKVVQAKDGNQSATVVDAPAATDTASAYVDLRSAKSLSVPQSVTAVSVPEAATSKFKRKAVTGNVLQKVNGETSYNSTFSRTENFFIQQEVKATKQRLKNALYQEESLKAEKITVPDSAKQELDAHIHQHQNMLSSLIETYLGINGDLSKQEKVEMWRKTQMIQNLDFEQETVNGVQYPGSKKGPNPEDDPQHFTEWYSQNMTPAYKVLLEEIQKIRNLKARMQDPPRMFKRYEGSPDDEEENVDTGLGKNSAVFWAVDRKPNLVVTETLFSAPLSSQWPEIRAMDEFKSAFESIGSYVLSSPLKEGELPIAPGFNHTEWNRAVPVYENWSMFRLFPDMMRQMKNFNQGIKDMLANKWDLSRIKVPVLPTIYAYYYTLPEKVRDDPIVRNVVRKLEMVQHNVPLQEKQSLLNQAAQYTLPLDEMADYIFTQIADDEKFQIHAADEDKFLKVMLPFEAWPLDKLKEFEQEIQKPKTGAAAEQDWPRLKYLKGNDIAEQLPLLPFDFYDNGDGFWDETIKKKKDEYAKVPLPNYRPFLQH